MKTLLFATAAFFCAAFCAASPASAGRPWIYGSTLVTPEVWVCVPYEYAKRCNAEWNVRRQRCGCLTR
jgi:hypothetical protein